MITRLFYELTNPLPWAMLLLGEDGRVRGCNASAARMLESEERDLLDHPLPELVTDPLDKAQRYVQIWLRCKDPFPGSLCWRSASGRTIATRCYGNLIYPERSAPQRFVLVRAEPKEMATNKFLTLNRALEELKASHYKLYEKTAQLNAEVAERRRIEDELRESEMRYRKLVRAVKAYTYTVEFHENGAVSTHHSEGCISVTGYRPADYEQDPYLWYSMVYDEDRSTVRQLTDDISSGKDVGPLEHRITRRDGAVIWIRNTIVPYRTSKGELYRYDGMIEDITERKRLEEEMRTNRNFLEAIINAEPACVKLLGPDGTLSLMNPAGLAMIEASSCDEVKGKCVYPLVVPEHREAFIRMTEEVFRGTPATLEFEMAGLKGRRLWLETHSVPLRNSSNEIVALLGVTRDITARKESEGEMRKLNEELERKVRERTAELERRNFELEQMNKVFVGRELRMSELKTRIRLLEQEKKMPEDGVQTIEEEVRR